MNVTRYLSSKQSQYEKLPSLIKVMAVGAASILGLAGIALLTIPILFDLSVILILLSLGVLSFQFSWARDALIYITSKLENKSFRKKLFITLTILFIVFVVAIVVWHR